MRDDESHLDLGDASIKGMSAECRQLATGNGLQCSKHTNTIMRSLCANDASLPLACCEDFKVNVA